ncbi:MBL fold metallo-hydrolase [Halorubrum vacuolatum]|uniref:Glyoxylase, beta-lactamase superfamily II n=1 Tax=Halorubrum vacuolatum TaxID=63740 RepID=A0A238XV90_HALVU|nr:MBL fold metallo-hydrolase [Halorubrum vacuolatum]SNR62244.1 Glyoxylase, beta-lactamase superfamily II [Halorubrum vacuolatum]
MGRPAGGPESAVVRRIPVPVETTAPGGTTNAYVIDVPGGDADRTRILVDPGARSDALDAAVLGLDESSDPMTGVDSIAVTHTHPDHVGAADAYAEATGATVLAHADHVERFRSATGVDPEATIADGDTIGSTNVEVLETPGHAPDGLSFRVPGREQAGGDSILIGDLAVETGSVAVAVPDGDLRAYLASLERLRESGASRLWPGHGPVITDPAATCTRLIEHRLERERRILDAIDAGASDVEGVLEAAYRRDLSGVEGLARRTVLAHLGKLVADGRIDRSWIEDAR